MSIKRIIAWLFTPPKPSIYDLISQTARLNNRSEHDLFHAAAEPWGYSRYKVDTDFVAYLKEGHVPHYVRVFVGHASSPTAAPNRLN